jgi:hypothetical protein
MAVRQGSEQSGTPTMASSTIFFCVERPTPCRIPLLLSSEPGPASTPPPDVGTGPDVPPTLLITPWRDPVIDTLGHDPRS